MKIAVCMKQVPAYTEGNMDEKTGALIRNGLEVIANVYDVSALETALQIKEQLGAEITVFTMGPSSAEVILREAYSMGADKGCLICDKAFAGSDVLATSYTLWQAIKSQGAFDLILCGKQTTDGDTAQVSGALAQWFQIGHVNWVSKILEITKEGMTVIYEGQEEKIKAKVGYPCLLSVEKSIFVPRMPSLKLRMAGKKKPIIQIDLKTLENQNAEDYGFSGSATKVIRIFPPASVQRQKIAFLKGEQAAEKIFAVLDAVFGKEGGEG